MRGSNIPLPWVGQFARVSLELKATCTSLLKDTDMRYKTADEEMHRVQSGRSERRASAWWD